MKTQLKETSSGKMVAAEIKAAGLADMPLKRDGWQFNWRELHRENKQSLFFKLTLHKSPEKAEGMVVFTMLENGLLYMDCIEVAPTNYGSKGRYDYVAGSLLAIGCLFAGELGRDVYKGYLHFTSKTALIGLYVNKYGAMRAGGQKLFFNDIVGKKLIDTYLIGDQ